MAFQAEIEKLARTRRAYLRFALAENRPDRIWTGGVDRRYGKVGDAQGIVPVMATVSRFGTIQRSLANYLYSLEVPNVSIELFDPEREWHALTGGSRRPDHLPEPEPLAAGLGRRVEPLRPAGRGGADSQAVLSVGREGHLGLSGGQRQLSGRESAAPVHHD